MDNNNTIENNNLAVADENHALENEAMVKLTPMDLNSIKLDPKHTVLTPNYLDSLES